MKSRVTILAAVFLLAALAMPQLTEAQGFNVSKGSGINKVIASGNNQLLPTVKLTTNLTEGAETPLPYALAESLMLTFEFGGLPIINATVWYQAVVDAPATARKLVAVADLDPVASDIQLKWSSGGTKIQVLIPTGFVPDATSAILIDDLRVDVSSVDAGDHVPITISTDVDEDFVSFGTSNQGISSTIVMAADGLTVGGTKATALSCAKVEGAEVKVTEGFAGAWNMNSTRSVSDDPLANDPLRLRIEVSGFPDVEGAALTWPDTVPAEVDGTEVAWLKRDKEDSLESGRVVFYEYSQDTDDATDGVQVSSPDAARSFVIPIEGGKNLGAADLNVSAQLWPKAKRNSDGKKNTLDLRSALSFEHALEDPTFADDAPDGAWLVVSDCITYLLYPFVTCQTAATPQWTTGISVSNTSRDAGVFGRFDETEEQSGSVTLYGFPKSVATINGSGRVPEPFSAMLRSNLAAGDTYTFTCSNHALMAGMEGYAIIKANFQHARGMAFVVADTDAAGGLDVAHGYMAEVIENPAERSDTLME